MTSPNKAPKPHMLRVDLARAELLTMALTEQRQSLRRTLQLLDANPHKNAEEKLEVEQTKLQLRTCDGLYEEMSKVEIRFKEW